MRQEYYLQDEKVTKKESVTSKCLESFKKHVKFNNYTNSVSIAVNIYNSTLS